jgi:hypothetical protein
MAPSTWSTNNYVPTQGFERLGYFTIHQEQIEAIRCIQRNTAASEAIFVGVGRHDKIHANNTKLNREDLKDRKEANS